MLEGQNPAHSVDLPFAEEAQSEPWRFDWFGILRWLNARNPSFPRFGTAARPALEVVRISQPPSLGFAPAALARYGRGKDGVIHIEQTAFGLFGPNGPMPLHFTEFARERGVHDDDATLQSFLDIFHHRFALLFYRAWADTQPAASLDRPETDHFSRYAGSLIGYGEPFFERRDLIPAHAKRYMAGHLVRLTRNPEGLTAILRGYFNVPFQIQEWMPRKLKIRKDDCTRLGEEAPASRLGGGAICGTTVLDRQHGIRIHAGPLKWDEYQLFLPIGAGFRPVRDWVRNYVGIEYTWDFRLILRHDEIPPLKLGAKPCRLGWTTWLGHTAPGQNRGDLVLEGERPDSPALLSAGKGHPAPHESVSVTT
ncbi:MAG: type VI secretion system baseplate subunit TssG [Azoarcus sp.]|nr:type VI secretion system baseplate subunit TssG [Azoarcus sp.]